jgi:hypothetical protein
MVRETIANGGSAMKGKKTDQTKKTGTLRPWLVDVIVEGSR